ncbi:hypothetical protein [Comamonas thiooxydans]|uniref:hypothetical protein n=1 Tax=Comamonas thiooxydans TaxID=363952 RepID=UPI0001BB0E51|nr:hypothetical protein [Comamonas thiooxydans]ACY31880.1 hypothetical protein CtCNB1_1134 [Comamonas thiooxydans]MDO1474471.1 hypothetical protein [Comamonas thiooxydans]
MSRQSRQTRSRSASWTQVQLGRDQHMRQRLQKRHWLRLHAAVTGGLSLAAMSLISLCLLHAGVHSMGLRYGLALACGYLLYLLLVRLWAGCMLRRDWDTGDVGSDVPGSSGKSGGADTADTAGLESGQGGSYGGGGAGGHWDDGAAVPDIAPASSGLELPDVDVSGLDALDEGAVVLVPVLLVFAVLLVAVTGMGSLVWLVFGADLFLTVAVEVAFALLMTRTLYVVEREGWLLAALRISWKPVLGALVAAVALGLLADWLFPQADTLAQVLRSL